MDAILQLALKHGYSILFAAIFAHEIGLPIPGPLFLLAAGALVAAGKLDLVAALGLAVIACVLADWAWYEAARRRGDKVLHFIHRLATRDPDYHDRRAKATFAKYGPPIILVAKFVPGLDAVVPPLAGTSRLSRLHFLVFDAVGSGLYSALYGGLGYVFSNNLERAAGYVGRAGSVLTGLVFAGLLIFAAPMLVRWYRSQRVSRLAEATENGEP
jgi:membrane protein DedA with SNARE-associated domain